MAQMSLNTVEVLIQEVTDDGQVLVIDGHTKQYRLPLIMRASGMNPRPGETWFMSRETGYWNLSAVKTRLPPEITGSRSDGSALASLLSALEESGVIKDSTTP